MRAEISISIVVIISLIVIVVVALFVLSWVGLGTNPLDWFKKNELKARFCAEVQERTNCQVLAVYSAEDLGIDSSTESLRIKRSEVGLSELGSSGSNLATYGEICNYFGYKNKIDECLVKLCGCKITSVK